MNRSHAGLITLTFLLMSGCGDSTGPADVGSISISATQTTMSIGSTLQLSATVLNSTGATISNAALTWRSSDDAIATVSTGGLVTAVAGGVVRITASAGGVSDEIDISVQPPACTTAMTAGTIAAGQTRNGTLTASTCLLPNNAAGAGWLLTLGSETTLRMSVSSSELDAIVVITDMQLNPLSGNDDGGSGSDAVLFARLPAGSYVIWATTFPGETGAYQLAVSTAQTGSCTAPTGSIATSQTVTGVLAETDCLMDHGGFADIWQFTTAAPITVQIDLTSTAFDTFLLVADSTGTFIAGDDDGGGNFNSRITRTFAAGTYALWATSYESTAFGAYQLSVVGSGAPGASGRNTKTLQPVWGMHR